MTKHGFVVPIQLDHILFNVIFYHRGWQWIVDVIPGTNMYVRQPNSMLEAFRGVATDSDFFCLETLFQGW